MKPNARLGPRRLRRRAAKKAPGPATPEADGGGGSTAKDAPSGGRHVLAHWAGTPSCRGGAAGTPDDPQKLRDIDRLDQMVSEARSAASFPVRVLSIPRQRHQVRRLGAGGSNAGGEIVTVHDGQTDVDHDDGRPVSIEYGQRIGPIVRRGHVVARFF